MQSLVSGSVSEKLTPSENTKNKLRANADYILYLLNLFDGKISYTEIMNMDYALLTEMKTIKEMKVEKEQQDLQREQAKHNSAIKK